MKNLPIGIQTLTEIRNRNCVYVDKTQLVHQLVTTGKYYFFARPRRFGKSLLISTLKELFSGNKAVFEGLWIENKWDWTKKKPVFHISFDTLDYNGLGLDVAINREIDYGASIYDVTLTETTYKAKFRELIRKLSSQHGNVVVLIDEYDKPIIDFLEKETIEQAKVNRDILREFYSVLKNADEDLELVFITGISKFSKVSIFSHLNNLEDITIDEKYATLVGYTQTEIENNFEDYLKAIETKLNISRAVLLETMRIWYNGYSWDGVNRLYNPFGALSFFSKKQFQNFWFSTGSPKFLITQMRKHTQFAVENSIANNITLEKYDIENLELIPLLFQTGYLTVKEIDVMTGDMVLDYPNKEVRESMYQFLIDDLAKSQIRTHTGRTMQDINKALISKDLGQVKEIINGLLADMPYHTFDKQTEGLYHGLVHLIFSYLGMFVQSEVHSSRGRADAVVQTLTDIFIFEFKFNKTAQEALDQIYNKKYADKYRASNKPITGIGLNFDSTERQIDGWIEATL
jgi:Predicted AAA-ATPase/PD-(D/E)XK nuclease superfamily